MVMLVQMGPTGQGFQSINVAQNQLTELAIIMLLGGPLLRANPLHQQHPETLMHMRLLTSIPGKENTHHCTFYFFAGYVIVSGDIILDCSMGPCVYATVG
jgi:hypothetical protein